MAYVRVRGRGSSNLSPSLLDKELDLLRTSAASSVRDRPRRLLAYVEFCVRKELDQRGYDVVVDDCLDLVLVPGCDVRDGPAGLLAYALLGTGEEGEEAGESVVVDDELRLEVVAGDDVPHGPERGRLDGGGGVQQQLDEAAAHPRLDDRLYLLVGAVAQVRQRPTGVGEDLLVGTEDELAQCGEGVPHEVEVRLGLPAAKVAERPGGVTEHAELAPLVELLEEGLHGPRLQD